MRVVYIKLVNHIPFKEDVELSFGSASCILIKGKTGSGKSYVLSSLHPFSNSSRHFKEYAIYPHKRGYKEIHYEDRDNLYIIRHEYVPNNRGSHSCKSYFMKNGKELNENGNNDTFKEFVKKFLNYDQEVSNFSLLSVKSSGFIDSTPIARNSLLFSLIESSSTKLMKSNLNSNITDNNARLRLFKESRDEILTNRNIEEDKSSLRIYKDSISVLEENIDKKIKEREKLIVELTQFKERVNSIDKKSLDNIVNFFIKIEGILNEKGIKTVKEFSNYALRIDTDLNEITSKYNILESERKNSLERYKNLSNKRGYQNKLKEVEDDMVKLENKLKDYFNVSKIDKINSIEYSLTNYTKIKRSFSNLRIMFKDIIDMRNYIDEQRNLCKNTESQLQTLRHLEKYRGLVQSEENTLCPKCKTPNPILIKIFKSLSECNIGDLERDYESKIKEVDILTRMLEELEKVYDDVINSCILSESFVNDKKFNTFDGFVNSTLLNNSSDAIMNIIDIKNYGASQWLRLIEEKNSIDIKLSMLDTEGVLEQEYKTLKETEEKIDKCKSKLEALYSLKSKLKNELDFTEFGNYTIEEIFRYNESNKNVFETINKYQKDLDTISYEIDSLKSELETNKNRIVFLNSIIDRFQEIHEQLNIYSNKKKDLDIIKTILFQDIPKLILEDNIRYLEDTINLILTQNNIDMTISFKTDDKNGISIPVYINSKAVPDAKALSSGETSLLSTLINTSLLSLLGYKVLMIDELDAHLDTIYREVFGKIISSICRVLDIDQVFFISHNISLTEADLIIAVGDKEGLDIDNTKPIINIY